MMQQMKRPSNGEYTIAKMVSSLRYLVTALVFVSVCYVALLQVTGGVHISAHDGSFAPSEESLRRLQSTVGRIDRFILINADTNVPIIDLIDGMIINVATQSTANYNIQATVANGTVGSMRFGYNEKSSFRIESGQPYALCGDIGGDYFTCTNLSVVTTAGSSSGQHNVSATPYAGTKGSGIVGNTKMVSFRIVNVSAASAPSAAPSSAPSPIPICNIPQFLDPTWSSFKPNHPNSTAEAMGLIIGNDFISFSGFVNNFAGTSNQTYARDVTIANSPWRRMDDMPLAVSTTHAPIVRIGAKVHICGGYHGGHPGPHVAYCFAYDHSIPPGTGQQWTRFTDLPNNGYAGGGMIYDTLRDTLYFAGGGQRLTPGNPHPVDFNRTFKYSFRNPSVGWVETKSIPYTGNHLSSVTQTYLGKERHYFVGGQMGENENTGNLANVYEFIASNETWARRTFMPFARGHVTSSTRPIGCGFIIAGGSLNTLTTSKNRTKNIMYYDIPTDTWTTVGEMSVVRATPLVDIHSNGYMYYVSNKATERRRFSV